MRTSVLSFWTLIIALGSGACTPAQSAEAKSCLEQPALQACQISVLVDCVSKKTCDLPETAKAVFTCLKLCEVGEAGAAGQ